MVTKVEVLEIKEKTDYILCLSEENATLLRNYINNTIAKNNHLNKDELENAYNVMKMLDN